MSRRPHPIRDRGLVARLTAHFERAWASEFTAGTRPEKGQAAAGPAAPIVALPPRDTAPLADAAEGPWWRTVSGKDTQCGSCRGRIVAWERFAYRHDDRAVRCRACGSAIWDDARPSKALRNYAEHRRLEQELAA